MKITLSGAAMGITERVLGRKALALSFIIITTVAISAFSAGVVFGLVVSNLGKSGGGKAGTMALEDVRRSSIDIVAVKSSEDSGALLTLNVELRPGTGEIYVNTSPLVESDFQYAQWVAVDVAASYLDLPEDGDGVGIKGVDVSFSLTSDEQLQLVGGPSAGAAMTVLTIAVLENRPINKNVVITGEIREDGSIAPVGGLTAKVGAAAAAGKDLFLVPKGQLKVTVYREVTRQVGRLIRTVYEPVVVDLEEYAESMGWDIRIQEVSTIQEAVSLMMG
jgi:predicted S18 family serine protease